jgi:23S rRNA pseudouridine1911/1915/1917 synthase
MSDRQPRVFVVDTTEAGLRLDAYLDRHCADLSRSQIQSALVRTAALVNGKPRPKGFRLRGGEEIRFQPPPAPSPGVATPQAIPLAVVYEDDQIVVIDKPAGMVVHPAPGHPDGTLVNAVLHRFGDVAGVGHRLRPGIVHRLDRDTTGLLVVALTEAAHRHLADQLARRTLRRIYLALSWGCWPHDVGTLEGAIGRHPRDRLRMAVLARGGRDATTHYRVLEDYGFAQLCRVELATGRTHQIRVHFAHHGHPIFGDPLYGDDRRVRNVHPDAAARARAVVKLAGRQLLHAAVLGLEHPTSGAPLEFRAEPPADFRDARDRLRGDAGPHSGGTDAPPPGERDPTS